jgi:hypothetical protein
MYGNASGKSGHAISYCRHGADEISVNLFCYTSGLMAEDIRFYRQIIASIKFINRNRQDTEVIFKN